MQREDARLQGTPFPIGRVPDAPRDGWDSDALRAYGVRALPTVVRIDAGGKAESVGVNLARTAGTQVMEARGR